ncbi:MAG: type II toxin-antitoxin system RelE/ParE family toxin [Rhodoferax sp.]|nr:type II toxin-antitoxin system RelE/ParE family toxin [Rhodoferax sp.]
MKQIEKTPQYQDWFTGLADVQVQTRIAARVRRLTLGNAGDAEPVGEGVSELRLHFGAGWRVYYTERAGQIILLLAGGNKGTQKRDIQLALELARNL